MSAPAPWRAQVCVAELYLRAGPSQSFAPVGRVRAGTELIVVDSDGEWVQIALDDGSRAWAAAPYLQRCARPLSATPSIDDANVNYLEISEPEVALATHPRLGGSLRSKLRAGAVVRRLGLDDDVAWVRSAWGDGFVPRASTRPLPGLSSAEQRAALPGVWQRPQGPYPTALEIPLAADERLPLEDEGAQRLVARAWNAYGGMLGVAAEALQTPRENLVALLCVAFANPALGRDGRLHLLFDAAAFEAFTRRRIEPPADGPEASWQALAQARDIEEELALGCTRMGAAALPGSAHEACGFSSARSMFDALRCDLRLQLAALLRFVFGTDGDSALAAALRRGRFESFVARYFGAEDAGVAARMRALAEATPPLFQRTKSSFMATRRSAATS